MKKYLLVALIALGLSVPANSGFITGYIIGSATASRADCSSCESQRRELEGDLDTARRKNTDLLKEIARLNKVIKSLKAKAV